MQTPADLIKNLPTKTTTYTQPQQQQHQQLENNNSQQIRNAIQMFSSSNPFKSNSSASPPTTSSFNAPKSKRPNFFHSVKIKAELSRQIFTVPTYYKLLRRIGQGGYGLVVKAIDLRTNTQVAIKKIKTGFRNRELAKRLLRQIKIMKFFKHENIIQIRDILNPLSLKYFNEVYIVTDLMDADLRQTLKSNELSEQHISYFMFQLLSGLRFLHSADIVHRDLKPGNLLVTKECDLHICDFGLARPVIKSLAMTDYVTTRYYRAPEIILNQSKYSQAVDMWAVGCIMAELFKGKPIFPGNNYVHQVQLIISVIGTPTTEQIASLQCDAAQRYIKNEMPKTSGIQLKDLVPRASTNALDLIKNLLLFDFDKRLSADQALKHPFFSQFQEFLCDLTQSKEKFDFSFENEIRQYTQVSQLANIVENSQTLAQFKKKEMEEALKISEQKQAKKAPSQELLQIEQVKQSIDEQDKKKNNNNNQNNNIDFGQTTTSKENQQNLNSKDSIEQLQIQRNDNKVTPKFSQFGIEQGKLDIESSVVKEKGKAVIGSAKVEENQQQPQQQQQQQKPNNNNNANLKLTMIQWNQQITHKIQIMVYQQMKEFYPGIFINLSEQEREERLLEFDKMFVQSIRNASVLDPSEIVSPRFNNQGAGAGAGGGGGGVCGGDIESRK